MTLFKNDDICITPPYLRVILAADPKASFSKLSSGAEKKGVKAPPEAIAQLFKDHDLKKNPKQ